MAATPTPVAAGEHGSRAAMIALAVLLSAAYALRWWLVSGHDFLSVDAVFYLDQTARLLGDGRLPYSVFPPGWPFLIAVPVFFADHPDPGHLLKAAQHLNALLGSLLPLLTYLLIKRHLGSWMALASAVVIAFLPEMLVLSKTALSEISYACALLGAWLVARRRVGLVAGLLFGYAYLIRPEALLAAAGLGLLEWRQARRLPWQFAVGVLVPVIPYVAFLQEATGAWSLSGKTVAMSQSLETHPGWQYPLLVVRNVRTFVPLLAGLVGFPLALLALMGVLMRPRRWFVMLLPLLSIPLIINPMVVRFWAPYLPYLMLAAGLAANQIIRGEKRLTPRGRRWAAVALFVVTAGFLGEAVSDDVPGIARSAEAYHSLKDAGAWLRPHVDRDSIVAGYKPYASFWAGCSFLKYPAGMDAAEIAIWARQQGVSYLVVNVAVAYALAPNLKPFLETPLPPELAGQVSRAHLLRYEAPQLNTVIYRVER